MQTSAIGEIGGTTLSPRHHTGRNARQGDEGQSQAREFVVAAQTPALSSPVAAPPLIRPSGTFSPLKPYSGISDVCLIVWLGTSVLTFCTPLMRLRCSD